MKQKIKSFDKSLTGTNLGVFSIDMSTGLEIQFENKKVIVSKLIPVFPSPCVPGQILQNCINKTGGIFNVRDDGLFPGNMGFGNDVCIRRLFKKGDDSSFVMIFGDVYECTVNDLKDKTDTIIINLENYDPRQP